jgi:hypothetical protein
VVEVMLIGFGAAVRFGLQIDAVENMALFGEFDPSGDGSINYYEFIERNKLRLSNRIESNPEDLCVRLRGLGGLWLYRRLIPYLRADVLPCDYIDPRPDWMLPRNIERAKV